MDVTTTLCYRGFRRVHISAVTKSFIPGTAVQNYRFEEGHGASREPALKNMLTYFVTWRTNGATVKT